MYLLLIPITMFVAIVASLQFGRWIGRRIRRDADTSRGAAAVDSIVFAVLGLIVAFTFTAAAARFDERRRLIVDHANATGTVWLRLDLLPEADRPPIRSLIKQWIQSILNATNNPRTSPESIVHFKEAADFQDQVWQSVIASYERDPRPAVATQLIPALNTWIDLSTSRIEIGRMTVPSLVMVTLFVLSFGAAVLVGYEMSNRPRQSWLHVYLFAGTISFAVYVIVDLNNPREGLIRISSVDKVFHDLLTTFNTAQTRPTTAPQ